MHQVRTIIGIAGASGAGKTHFANELLDRMRQGFSDRDVTILNEDCYYRRRDELSFEERKNVNFDHPDAIEHELLIEHIHELRNGKAVDVPQYDYAQHNRASETIRHEPSTVLILEGILILHLAQVRELLDLKIFVDVPLDICLSRRLQRDMKQRGRSLDSVLAQYHDTVRPMFFEFIQPSKNHADIIVPRGGENEAAIQMLLDHVHALHR